MHCWAHLMLCVADAAENQEEVEEVESTFN